MTTEAQRTGQPGRVSSNCCATCNAVSAAQRCSGCRQVRYCNQAHAKSHWKEHKPVCKALNTMTAEQGWVKTVVKEGSGRKPESGEKCWLHYTGRFVNGRLFDCSRKNGKGPFSFTLVKDRGQQPEVIMGWEQGVRTMKVGESSRLVIHESFAYGDRGYDEDIPPNVPLVFMVELLAIGDQMSDGEGADAKGGSSVDGSSDGQKNA